MKPLMLFVTYQSKQFFACLLMAKKLLPNEQRTLPEFHDAIEHFLASEIKQAFSSETRSPTVMIKTNGLVMFVTVTAEDLMNRSVDLEVEFYVDAELLHDLKCPDIFGDQTLLELCGDVTEAIVIHTDDSRVISKETIHG